MRKFLVPLLLLLAVGSLAAACGGGSKNTVKVPGGGDLTISKKLPDDFPKDFPVYKNADFKGSFSGTQQGIKGFVATWDTSDSADKVKEFYDKAFSDGPWKSDSNAQFGEGSSWTAENKDGTKTGYVLTSAADGKTSIVATVGDKPKDDATSTGGSSTSTSGAKKTATADTSGSSGTTPTSGSSDLPAEAKLAKDFPSDRVPFPSGSRVTSVSSFGSGGSKTYSVELYVKEAADKLSDYFATELPKHGWTSGFTSQSNGEYLLTFAPADTAAAGQDNATISIQESDTAGYAKATIIVSIGG